MLALCLMLSKIYSAQNYADIIGLCLCWTADINLSRFYMLAAKVYALLIELIKMEGYADV